MSSTRRASTRRAAAKTDLLDHDALKSVRLRDGSFSAVVFGYSDNLRATVTVRGPDDAKALLQDGARVEIQRPLEMLARPRQRDGAKVAIMSGRIFRARRYDPIR